MEYERFEFSQPMFGGVNVLRVGDTLVDTGHVAPVCRDAVADELDGGGLAGVERVAVTHPHIDHVGGSETIAGLADLPHIVPEGVPDIVHDFDGYLREAREDMTRLLSGFDLPEDNWETYFPLDSAYADDAIRIERTVSDGESVRLGQYEVEAVRTPGHSAQHLAFWHEPSKTLLSGDLVSENGHFQYGPLHGDVGAYEESLRRVRDLDPDVLVPMHGPPMDDPRERIDEALAKAERTEERIVAAVEDSKGGGGLFARDLAREVLGADEWAVTFMTLVVWEYVRHLDREGRLAAEVTDDGIRVEPS